MGFEPTTPTLATFGFMRQSSDFCVVSMHDGTERHKNIRNYADVPRTNCGRLLMASAASRR